MDPEQLANDCFVADVFGDKSQSKHAKDGYSNEPVQALGHDAVLMPGVLNAHMGKKKIFSHDDAKKLFCTFFCCAALFFTQFV